MAGLGRRVFAAGEVLTAGNVMGYLQDQAVMNFAGTAARGSAIGTAVSEGMTSYLADNNFVQVHDGTAWRSVAGVQVASGTAARDALLPSPVQGDKVFRNDLGYEQTYYGAYGTANPGGRSAAGWYDNQRNMGLVPIVPPTVNYSGGTATANSLGVISFNAVTSISLNNIFSSSYSNYRIIFSGSLNTAAQTVNLRFRASGADNTGTYVFGFNLARITGSSALYTSSSSTSGGALIMNSGASGPQTAVIDILSPYIAANNTTWSSTGYWADSTSAMGASGAGLHAVTASYDGISIFPAGGNITGTITIYGYNS